MVVDVWAVDYLMRAECKRRRDGRLIWLYLVKWRNNGNFSCLRLPESDALFERDPSIVKKFWESTPYSPEDMQEGTDIIPPPSYVESCQAITAAYIESSKDNQIIPAKRKPSSSPTGSPAPPSHRSPPLDTPELRRVGTRNIVVSDHSEDEDSLPDYEDDEDIVMQSADCDDSRNQNEDTNMDDTQDEEIFSQVALLEEELFGPPVLGIDDDDLYAPHPPQQTAPEQPPHDVGPGGSSEPLVHVEPVTVQTVKGSLEDPRPSRIYKNTQSTPSSVTVSEDSTPVLKRERPGFGLKINMTKPVLPLEITDPPPDPTFSGLFSTTPCLDSHGFYRHTDIQSSIEQWREGDLCDTAQVRLEKTPVPSPATEERRATWDELKNFLFEKEMVCCWFDIVNDA